MSLLQIGLLLSLSSVLSGQDRSHGTYRTYRRHRCDRSDRTYWTYRRNRSYRTDGRDRTYRTHRSGGRRSGRRVS